MYEAELKLVTLVMFSFADISIFKIFWKDQGDFFSHIFNFTFFFFSQHMLVN